MWCGDDNGDDHDCYGLASGQNMLCGLVRTTVVWSPWAAGKVAMSQLLAARARLPMLSSDPNWSVSFAAVNCCLSLTQSGSTGRRSSFACVSSPSSFASVSSVACVSLVLQIHRRIMTHDRPRWRTMSRVSLHEPLRRR